MRWIAAVLLALLAVVLFAPTTIGGATTYVIVTGSSMQPTFEDGDLVVVRRGTYETGEVVAFDTGRGVVIHRIVGGSGEEGFVMQGDNKETTDTWHPTVDDIVGKEFATIPKGGRWAQRIAGSPALLGVTVGGLGSLMFWSPKRRRRRGAHVADGAHPRSGSPTTTGSIRGAGSTLLASVIVATLLVGLTTYLFLRPLERLDTVEQVLYEHSGEFSYTALVEDSVVYDSDTINSPADGAEPTAVFTELLDDLIVRYDYELLSPANPDMTGTLSADLRIGTGESKWTRNIPLLEPMEFDGRTVSESFSVDIGRVRTLVARAEQETGLIPGIYQAYVVSRVELRGEPGATPEIYTSELPMELRDKLLVIINELATEKTTSEAEESLVPNDLGIFGYSLSTRLARALAGALLAMVVVGGTLYWAMVRRRIGKGELGRINLRYGPLIVPVTGEVPNGSRPVDVATMADLARLARRAEQMVFHSEPSPGEHWFFVPDGPVTYKYHLTD